MEYDCSSPPKSTAALLKFWEARLKITILHGGVEESAPERRPRGNRRRGEKEKNLVSGGGGGGGVEIVGSEKCLDSIRESRVFSSDHRRLDVGHLFRGAEEEWVDHGSRSTAQCPVAV